MSFPIWPEDLLVEFWAFGVETCIQSGALVPDKFPKGMLQEVFSMCYMYICTSCKKQSTTFWSRSSRTQNTLELIFQKVVWPELRCFHKLPQRTCTPDVDPVHDYLTVLISSSFYSIFQTGNIYYIYSDVFLMYAVQTWRRWRNPSGGLGTITPLIIGEQVR